VTEAAAKAGYAAAVTCDYGRVKRGSDPLRMRRVAIEKKMDFATFRRLLGAGSMKIEQESPLPGQIIDTEQPVISAKIANHKDLDPKSVGMALLGTTDVSPYAYDPTDGSISLIVKDTVKALKGKYQRALVWATEARTGKRVEATWTFRLPEPPAPPAAVPAVDPLTCEPKPASPDPTPEAVPTEVVVASGASPQRTAQRQPK